MLNEQSDRLLTYMYIARQYTESSMIDEQWSWTAKLLVAFFYIWLIFMWSWSTYAAHDWFDVIAIGTFFLFTEMFWVTDYW